MKEKKVIMKNCEKKQRRVNKNEKNKQNGIKKEKPS